MLRLDCLLRQIWLTIKLFFHNRNTYTMEDGCKYNLKHVYENVTVFISECEHCGKINISWQKEKLNDADKRKLKQYISN